MKDDFVADQLTGVVSQPQPIADWFFAGPNDTANPEPGEQVN